jgi:predicted ATPase
MDHNPPLIEHLNDLKNKKNVRITDIKLKSLDVSNIQKMIADTLHLPPKDVQPLADLVYLKTKGNPFFVGRFLTTLSQRDLLVTRYYKQNIYISRHST